MKKLILVMISCVLGSFVISCKDSGGKTNLLMLPVSTAAADRTWVQDAYLKASNASADKGFGSSVAVSGDIIAVGSETEASSQTTITNTDGAAGTDSNPPAAGAVYVYKKNTLGNWIQDAYLRPSNAHDFEMFGCSVAVSGGIIVAGAHWDENNQSLITNDDGHPTVAESNLTLYSGAAFVFRKDASGNWIQDGYLKASNVGQDNFGMSVAVDGETIVVGAQSEASNQATITNTDNTASGNDTSVASGAVYVFKKDATGNWYQDAYLKASNVGASDYFGCSVAIRGDIIAVGAYQEDSNSTGVTNVDGSHADPGVATDSGAVYVFKRDATTGNWSQDAYLKASNGGAAGAGDNFGITVSISSDTIVVGAPEEAGQSTIINSIGHPTVGESNNDLAAAGAVYVFRREASGADRNWYQDAYLKASNAGAGDDFGGSVAVSGDTIAVSSNYEDGGQSTITNTDSLSADDDSMSNAGAVYVFKRDATGNWVQDAFLKASNSTVSLGMGSKVAVSGTTIVATARAETNTTPGKVNKDGHPTAAECSFGTLNVGAAYVFKVK
jgi:trimeric autotransporter adhesin